MGSRCARHVRTICLVLVRSVLGTSTSDCAQMGTHCWHAGIWGCRHGFAMPRQIFIADTEPACCSDWVCTQSLCLRRVSVWTQSSAEGALVCTQVSLIQ